MTLLARLRDTFLTMGCLLLVYRYAAAQVDAQTVEPGQVPGLLRSIIEAAQGGSWLLATGFLLTLIVAGARFMNILELIPDKYDGWVAMGLAMLGSVGGGLQIGLGWVDILIAAISVGAISIGGWELIIKKLRDRLFGRNRLRKSSGADDIPPPPSEGDAS